MKHSFNFFISVLLIFCWACNPSPTQKKTTESTNIFLSDYNEFIDTLTSVHPSLYEFVPKERFDQKVKQLRSEIDGQTTKRDFIWKMSEIMALVGCGHSSLGFFNQQTNLVELSEYFPLQARWSEGKFQVFDPMSNHDRVKNGDEITAINGVAIDKIVEESYKRFVTQAHVRSAKKQFFNVSSTTCIAYVLNFPATYTITVAGKKEAISLKPLQEKPNYWKVANASLRCKQDHCLEELTTTTALLTLRSFDYYGDKTPIMTNFLDASFKEIETKGYEYLMIDVRGNLGGTNAITMHLLKYTLAKPFQFYGKKEANPNPDELLIPFENNFKGKLFFLMNGDGYSSVGHLASIYKDQQRVTFIGDDLGSNQYCAANQKQFRLTNTQISYMVSRSEFFTAVDEQDRKQIISPDHRVIPSIDDFLNHRDPVLEYALKLIN